MRGSKLSSTSDADQVDLIFDKTWEIFPTRGLLKLVRKWMSRLSYHVPMTGVSDIVRRSLDSFSEDRAQVDMYAISKYASLGEIQKMWPACQCTIVHMQMDMGWAPSKAIKSTQKWCE